MIEPGTIYNEDCMETMERMDDNSVDLVLTDIPYGEVNREDSGLRNLNKEDADVFDLDLTFLIKEIVRITSGSLYIFCGTSQLSTLDKYIRDQDGMSRRLIIWEKTNPSPMNGKKLWLSGVEQAVYGRKPKATFNGHCENTVLRYPSGSSKIHPTEKPIGLFSELVKKSSNENDLVYDPFMTGHSREVVCNI